MVDISFNLGVAVDDNGVFDDIEDAVEQGIRSSRRQISSELELKAKHKILTAGAVWKGDLISSFETEFRKMGNKYVVFFKNTSDHAAPIEYGAEYDEKGPPVAALIPWVQTKMRGFNVPEDDLPDRDVDDIRSQAVEEATNQNTIDAVSLADPVIVKKAFWLQQHIKEHGIDAVKFMQEAEEWAKRNADRTVADHLNRRLSGL